MNKKTLWFAALQALMETDADKKIAKVQQLSNDWQQGRLNNAVNLHPIDLVEPARPEKPILVAGNHLSGRNINSEIGKAALVHAVVHIEFTAINLALDALYRFTDMPTLYYEQWIKVALDETKHFQLLVARLAELNHVYGDFPAHPALWDMAKQTRHDVLHRMAIVPKVLEARGLDVTPAMIQRFQNIKDQRTVDILKVILAEEIPHVAYGNQWFDYCCQQRKLDSQQTWFELLAKYLQKGIYCPVNIPARLAAGFAENDLQRLQQICTIGRQKKVK